MIKATEFVNGLILDISFGQILRTIAALRESEKVAIEIGDLDAAERHQAMIKFFENTIPVAGGRAEA
jgi:hypothetical protein